MGLKWGETMNPAESLCAWEGDVLAPGRRPGPGEFSFHNLEGAKLVWVRAFYQQLSWLRTGVIHRPEG